jgi:hypothetical protein
MRGKGELRNAEAALGINGLESFVFDAGSFS